MKINENDKKRFGIVTVAEMQAVTNELVELGYGEYDLICLIPFDVESSMYPSWDATSRSPVIGRDTIYLYFEEFNKHIKIPQNILEIARNKSPNERQYPSEFTVNTLNEILSDLINRGFSDYYVYRNPFEEGESKFGTFVLSGVEIIDKESEIVQMSIQRV